MRTDLVLKNGFRFRGKIIAENAEVITIQDIKVGNTTIVKTVIGARTDFEDSGQK